MNKPSQIRKLTPMILPTTIVCIITLGLASGSVPSVPAVPSVPSPVPSSVFASYISDTKPNSATYNDFVIFNYYIIINKL